MKFLKRAAAAALVLTAAASTAVSAGAVNWYRAVSFTDNGNKTKIVSSNTKKLVFTQGPEKGIKAVQIEWEAILADYDDINNIAKASWDITYSGLEAFNDDLVVAVSGGSGSNDTKGNWVSSAGYTRFADNITDESKIQEMLKNGKSPEWKDTVTVSDSITFSEGAPMYSLLIQEWTMGGTPDAPKDIDFAKEKVTVSISNLKIYDKKGKEIKQQTWHAVDQYSWNDLLKNPKDLKNIASYEFKATYSGLKKLDGTKVTSIGGSSWNTSASDLVWSKGYRINSDDMKDDKGVWTTDTVQVKDTVTFGSVVPEEWVFFGDMTYDWNDASAAKLFADKVNITYSDLKVYDKNGKEIKLKSGLAIAKDTSRPQVTAKSKKAAVALTWEPVAGATKYRVFRVDNGNLTKIANTKKTTYTVSGLTSGTKYQFAVKAYVGGKWTSVSKANIVTAKAK